MSPASDVSDVLHVSHDPELVAAFAAGDLVGTDRDRVRRWIGGCTECAALHADLLAIARATATVPPPFATRTRDFRLSPEQAARLRPTGWRRLVAAFAGPKLAVTRPLGVALTTIGLAGLLVTNVQLPIGMSSGTSLSAASAPPRAAASAGDAAAEAAGKGSTSTAGNPPAVGSAAASQAPGPVAVGLGSSAAPAASSGPRAQFDSNSAATPSAPPQDANPAANPAAPSAGSDDSGPRLATRGGSVTDEQAPGRGIPTTTALFGLAIVVGLGLLVIGRLATRLTRV